MTVSYICTASSIMRTWILGLQYKQYTTIKIIHPSKIHLKVPRRRDMALLHGKLSFCDFCSCSFCSALSPGESFGRDAGVRKAGGLWLSFCDLLQVDGGMDPKVRWELPGARHQHAGALRFCSHSPGAPFSSCCILLP